MNQHFHSWSLAANVAKNKGFSFLKSMNTINILYKDSYIKVKTRLLMPLEILVQIRSIPEGNK